MSSEQVNDERRDEMEDRDVRSLTDKEKAAAFKVIGQQLDKLERQHGESVVRWVANRRHEHRVELRRLNAEKETLEARLAEIAGG